MENGTYPEILTLYQISYNPKPPCFAKQNPSSIARRGFGLLFFNKKSISFFAKKEKTHIKYVFSKFF